MVFILMLVLAGLIGAVAGKTKNRVAAGFFFGLLLGPIGWAIILLGPTMDDGGDL